jgi:hypothetical protein
LFEIKALLITQGSPRGRLILKNSGLTVIVLAAGVLFSLPAEAESLCDLLPASKVKALLNLSDTLVAVPNTEWRNGCDYSVPHSSQPIVEAESTDDTGMDSIALTNHVSVLNDDDQRVSGIGNAAIYTDDGHEQDPSAPAVSYNRQSLIFRTDEKIVDFVVTCSGNGPTELAVLSLGKFAASEPLDSLKDPPN